MPPVRQPGRHVGIPRLQPAVGRRSMAVDPSSHVVVELSGTSTTVEVHRILAEAAAARPRAW